MKKIKAFICKKTGKLTLETEGFSGEACLEATKKLREGLRMDADPDLKDEFYHEEETNELQQGT